MNTISQTLIAVGVMIVKDDKALLSKRKDSHGAGEYAFPGGHVEYMESFEDAVMREIREECGEKLKVKNLKPHICANLNQYAPKHFVYIGFIAEWEEGEPVLQEPDRSDMWEWYDISTLPTPLFHPSGLGIEAYEKKEAFVFSDISA